MVSIVGCGNAYHAQDSEAPNQTTTEIPADIEDKVQNCIEIKEIFENDVVPSIQQNCAGCHGGDQAPFFAVKDFDLSFKRSLGLMNFINPENSLILKQSKNNHCGRSGCRGEKPELEQGIRDLAEEIKLCQTRTRDDGDDEPKTPQIAFDAGQKYFEQEVIPTLNNYCKTCHGRENSWRGSFQDKAISYIFKAPQYMKGTPEEIYESTKRLLSLERESFYGAPLFMAAIFLHYSNGTCKDQPSLEQEDQSPCLEIKTWWEIEKSILESQTIGL